MIDQVKAQKYELSELFKYIRFQYNLQQREISQKVGLSQSTISKIESGKISIDVTIYQKLCDAFEIPYEAFFYGSKFEGTSIESTKFLYWNKSKSFKILSCVDIQNINSHHPGFIKVRFLLPVVQFLRAKSSIFEQLKIPEYFFYNYDNLVNPEFLNFLLLISLETCNNLDQTNRVERELSLDFIFLEIDLKNKSFHGNLYSHYLQLKSKNEIINFFFSQSYLYNNMINTRDEVNLGLRSDEKYLISEKEDLLNSELITSAYVQAYLKSLCKAFMQ